jgi:hypothetical protein
MENKTVVFWGGAIGLVSFIIFGLLPSLVYGGYAGVVLANGIFNTPIHTNVIAQAIVVFMAAMSILACAGMFVVVGCVLALFAWFVGHLIVQSK